MKICSTLVALVLLNSCTPKATNSKSVKSEPVTTDELLEALGGFAFTIEIPASLSKSDTAGLAIVSSDGKVKAIGKIGGFVPGEKVRFICFHPKGGVFKCNFWAESGHKGGITSSNFPKNVPSYGGMVDQVFQVEQRIVRYSEDSTLKYSEEKLPSGDDFDLIFKVWNK